MSFPSLCQLGQDISVIYITLFSEPVISGKKLYYLGRMPNALNCEGVDMVEIKASNQELDLKLWI